ncbi:MAG: hypothetical protein OEY59_10300 [Deltaproteobacteria bacterium]|nr:hypothetical protein [Deltaproteobacteria bacterium]
MLRFYGIRFDRDGNPERYQFSMDLKETLYDGIGIHDRSMGDKVKALKTIDLEIQGLYQTSSGDLGKGSQLRKKASKWFRCKNMMEFILSPVEYYPLKLETARVLLMPLSIEQKWSKLFPMILQNLWEKDTKSALEQILSSESQISRLIKMVCLFFLEQDPEAPPANLELHLVKNQFPLTVWKKKDGLSPSQSPFWSPGNVLCDEQYLMNSLNHAYNKQSDALVDDPASKSQSTLFPGGNNFNPTNWSSTMGKPLNPDEIRLEFDTKENDQTQLVILRETAAETLMELQGIIFKKYKFEGLKQFLAILRQIAKNNNNVIIDFEEEKHFRLVKKPTRDLKPTEKEWAVFKDVFEMLCGLKVARLWKNAVKPYEIVSALIGKVGDGRTNSNRFVTHKILLDPLLFSSAKNPVRLGTHLCFVPDEVFKASSRTHQYLLNLIAYITGIWLNEYPKSKGILIRTAREIFEGSVIQQQNKLPSTIGKLTSELAYMKKSCYIHSYEVLKDEKGDIWEDQYLIKAPDSTLNLIAGSWRDTNHKPIAYNTLG